MLSPQEVITAVNCHLDTSQTVLKAMFPLRVPRRRACLRSNMTQVWWAADIVSTPKLASARVTCRLKKTLAISAQLVKLRTLGTWHQIDRLTTRSVTLKKLEAASLFLKSACLIVVIVSRLQRSITALRTSHLAVIFRPSIMVNASSPARIQEVSAILLISRQVIQWVIMRRLDPLESTNLKSTTIQALMMHQVPRDNLKVTIERSSSPIFLLLKSHRTTFKEKIVAIVLKEQMLWPLGILLPLRTGEPMLEITSLSVIRTQLLAVTPIEVFNKSKGNKTKCFSRLQLNVVELGFRLPTMLTVRELPDNRIRVGLRLKRLNTTLMKKSKSVNLQVHLPITLKERIWLIHLDQRTTKPRWWILLLRVIRWEVEVPNHLLRPDSMTS